MSVEISRRLAHVERFALWIGAFALVAAGVLAWLAPSLLAAAWRLAAFVCLAPALGSLLFLLIHRLTGGQWGAALTPFFNAGVALLPWIWLITLPLLLFPRRALPQPPEELHLYTSEGFYLVRAIVYGLVFFALGGLVRSVQRRRAAGDQVSRRWVAPAGLLALLFLLHLLADDWLRVLDPEWHSTAFPLVWMTGVAVAGLALAIVGALFAGAVPGAAGHNGRALGLDWGNLLLAAAMVWTYVAFAQFLIIWAGNLPREIGWYLRRTEGGWLGVIVALGLFHFALPFLFLLSRRFKRWPAGLGGAALTLLAAQWLFHAWLILPAFAPWSPLAGALALALSLGAVGLFLNRYLALARRPERAAS